MKKLRPSSRELAVTKEDEILDNVIDYCMSDDDPALRGSKYDRHERKVSSNSQCDAMGGPSGVVGEFLGAFAAKLLAPSACGPQPGAFQNSRSVAQRDYLYSQIDRQQSELDRLYPRGTTSVKPKAIRKERKPSGIMNNRSDDDGDDWDTRVQMKRTNVRDQVIVEEEDDSQGTYVVRVRSRESLVSELTELIPRGGVLRKNSGRSERALSGMESSSQMSVSAPWRGPASKHSPSSRTTPNRIGGGEVNSRVSGRHNYPNHHPSGNQSTTPSFRFFGNNVSQVESRNAVVNDAYSDTLQAREEMPSSFRHYAPFGPAPIAEEELEDETSMESIEVVRKFTDPMNQPSATDKHRRRKPESLDAQTISSKSANSAFTPVRRGEVVAIRPTPTIVNSSNSQMINSDKQSQKSNSSASTPKRRNHINPTVVCDKGSKCDTTVSTTSGNSFLERRLAERPNPCIAHTPLIGGLLLCGRGNKAERLAAEREEWSHILVYEPTPKSTKSEPSLPFSSKPVPKRSLVSPLTVLTDGASLEPSKAASGSRGGSVSPSIHNMPNKVNVPVEPPKPSLLLERRKAALRAKMEAAFQNATANSPSSMGVVSSPEAANQSSFFEEEDTRDAGETVENREDNRDLGQHVNFSDEEAEVPSVAAVKAGAANQAGFNVPGFKAKFWNFSGVVDGLTSELDQLAPMGSPRTPLKGTRASPRRTSRAWTRDGSPRRSRSPRKSKSPQPTETFSDYGTEFSPSPSAHMSMTDSAYTGFTSAGPYSQYQHRYGTVYDRKRMASRETYPTFPWQVPLDENSVGVMSLDY